MCGSFYVLLAPPSPSKIQSSTIHEALEQKLGLAASTAPQEGGAEAEVHARGGACQWSRGSNVNEGSKEQEGKGGIPSCQQPPEPQEKTVETGTALSTCVQTTTECRAPHAPSTTR